MIKVIELDIDEALSGDTGVFEVALVEYPAIEQELMYFGRYQFYKATQEIADVACQAIKQNEKRGNPAATQTGKVRAQQLCKREEISLETVKRMYSYLERAKVYNTDNWDDNGTISWKLWGGQPALDWSKRILDSLEKQEQSKEDFLWENPCTSGYVAYGTKMKNGREVPNCVKIENARQKFVKPNAGESKDDFVSRCIPVLKGEGYDDDQAAAICYSTYEEKFALDRVSFDWDEMLTSDIGRSMFLVEFRAGNVLYIISDKTRVDNDMLRFAQKYNIPGTRVFAVGSDINKVNKIKELGIVRHYDNNPQVIRDLPNVAMAFDYDTSALPAYNSYPESGDTESMLVKPQLPPVLFEDCGCSKEEEFNILGYIDGMPIVATPEEAEEIAEEIGCMGHHTHEDEDGNMVYMPCSLHPDYDDEEYELKEAIETLKKEGKFEAIRNMALNGLTRNEIIGKNVFPNKQVFYQYAVFPGLEGKLDSRDFCVSLEGKFFRRAIIDALNDYNTEFGHKRQPYSKWIFKGGPNCVHAWKKFI